MFLLAGPGDVSVMQDAVIALAGALLAALICTKLGVPLIIGFMLAGVAIGPSLTGLISNQDSIALLAEIGVVFLLFTIGLKFTIRELLSMKRVVFGVGLLQFFVTGAFASALAWIFAPITGMNPTHIFIVGVLIPHSSTALIMKSLEQRGDSESGPAKMAVGVSLFQDLSSIVWIVLVKQFAIDKPTSTPLAVIGEIGLSFLLVAALFVAARAVLPWFLRLVIGTRSLEVFSLASILVVIGTAYLCNIAGASLALGAFMAGIVITEADTTKQMLGEVRNIRDTLSSLFFVSIGLLLSVEVLAEHWLLIPSLAVAVLVLKFLIMAGVALALGFGVRLSVTSAVWLSQIGEFSFVIGLVALQAGLLPGESYPIFIAVVVLTMAVSPLLVPLGPWLAGVLEHSPALRSLRHNRVDAGLSSIQGGAGKLDGHVVIVGYGVNGRNVARMLRVSGVPTVIIELNPHTVREVRASGETIFYGDASRPEVLRHAGVERAKAVVVALPDSSTTGGVVQLVRSINPSVSIVARTRMVRDVEEIAQLGANAVIPEELETSLELAGRALEAVGASAWGIAQQKAIVRRDQYRALSDGFASNGGRVPPQEEMLPLGALAGADVALVTVHEGSALANKTLGEIHLRQRTGVSVIAVMRGSDLIRNPGADFVPLSGDLMYVFGSPAEVDNACDLLEAQESQTKSERHTLKH